MGDAECEWMNAAFALDELHQDEDFRDMTAAVDEMETKQQQEPSFTVGLETLQAFLSEMKQINGEATGIEETSSGQANAHRRLILSSSSPAVAPVAAVDTSIKKAKPKTRKLSSLERIRRQKWIVSTRDQLHAAADRSNQNRAIEEA